jgi:hypothetical protein
MSHGGGVTNVMFYMKNIDPERTPTPVDEKLTKSNRRYLVVSVLNHNLKILSSCSGYLDYICEN